MKTDTNKRRFQLILMSGLIFLAGNLFAQVNGVWSNGTDLEWGTTSLNHTTEIPMLDVNGNEYNLYFGGQSQMQNGPADIGVGYDSTQSLLAKLDVLNATSDALQNGAFTNLFAGQFYTTGSGDATLIGVGTLVQHFLYADTYTGVKGNSDVIPDDPTNGVDIGGDFTSSNGSVNIGGRGHVTAINTVGSNVGLLGFASNGTESVGVFAISQGGGTSSIGLNASGGLSAQNIGVQGHAANGTLYSYGVYGFIDPIASNTTLPNYAVYGDASGSVSDRVDGNSDYAGYFNGDVGYTGMLVPISDRRFKTDIVSFNGSDALALIHALRPKTYTFDSKSYPYLGFASGKQYGLISEEVESVLPQLIKNSATPPKVDSLGKVLAPSVQYKGLNYMAFIPILIAGSQQLDSVNNAQQDQIANLQAQINELKNMLQSTGSNGITTIPSVVLDQNSPNPFAEKTVIAYYIPSNVNDARIMIFDITGKLIQNILIGSRGQGSLEVYASNLSSGIYSYSLVADGKILDTKKMACTK